MTSNNDHEMEFMPIGKGGLGDDDIDEENLVEEKDELDDFEPEML